MMPLHRLLAPVLAAALACVPAPVHSQGADREQADPGGDSLMMAAPEGWVPVGQQRTDQLYELAYLPEGQSLEDWQASLQVQIFFNLAKQRPDLTPADFTENMVRVWSTSCEEARASPISSFHERGYPAAVRMLTCPRSRGGETGSVSMIKVMQGRASMYLLERAWRGPVFAAGDMPVAQETLDEWAEFLAATSLCNPDNAEAPCGGAPR